MSLKASYTHFNCFEYDYAHLQIKRLRSGKNDRSQDRNDYPAGKSSLPCRFAHFGAEK